jgi:hypothetical protein
LQKRQVLARFGKDVLDSKSLRRTELFPVCNVDIKAASFSTMCVSTGKSANATLIHSVTSVDLDCGSGNNHVGEAEGAVQPSEARQ